MAYYNYGLCLAVGCGNRAPLYREERRDTENEPAMPNFVIKSRIHYTDQCDRRGPLMRKVHLDAYVLQ